MVFKGNILVVDDNPSNLKLLVDTLSEDGYEVRPTNSGELAIVSASVKNPDIILLDIRMPDMDGFEVCKILKSKKETCNIPIIFISAAKETEDKVKGLQLGAVDFISKPFQREELLVRVSTHLELSRLRKHLEDLVEERTEKLEIEIEKHKQAKNLLAQSEIRFRNIFEHSVDAICVSLKGFHSFVNPSYISLFGFESDKELIGTPVLDLISPDEKEKILNDIKLYQNETLLASNYETIGRKKNGSLFNMEVHISNYELNNELYSLLILRDITIWKQTEMEIKQLNEELELRVAQRTNQLEVANKELEAFSYSVSHDLRAPLRHISGYANLLANCSSDVLSEKGKEYLSNITKSVTQMGNLIDDLLKFSRAGRQELRFSKIDMKLLITDVYEQIKPDILNRNINLNINDLPNVMGDLNLLKSVLFNLLSNAVKFTQKKEVAIIDISFTQDDKEYTFSIHDNGVGFDMNYADKLFGVFQRLHSSGEFEGTGIGLANVRRIINRHGGRVWANAEIDNGATFYFTLPKKDLN